MKRNQPLLWLVVAAILLSSAACGPRATPEPTPEPTATEQPTNTPEPTATATLEPTATVDTTLQPASGGTPAAPGTGPVDPAAPAAPAASGGGVSVDDKYLYVSQTIPDGYQVRPNTSVTIKWTVKNVGATAWDTTYFMDQFAGPPIKTTQVFFPKVISANQSAELTLTFTTPATYGDYNLWMKLKNGRGERFGDVNLLFTVTDNPDNSGKPAATPTP